MIRKPWLLAGIAAVAAVVLCACAIGGYALWVNPSPARVTEQYLDAYQDRDTAEVSRLVCASKRGSLSGLGGFDSWEIISSDEQGDRATVRAKVDESTITITLVREEGSWRVCRIR